MTGYWRILIYAVTVFQLLSLVHEGAAEGHTDVEIDHNCDQALSSRSGHIRGTSTSTGKVVFGQI